jgi:hypothetical protein
MPHQDLNRPNDAASFAPEHGYKFTLPAGKTAWIKINFSTPLWENAGQVFDLTQDKEVANDNIQQPQPRANPFGPFEEDHELLVVGSHKDGDWNSNLPWHQSWHAVYKATPTLKQIGFSDSGVPRGNFEAAHVQTTIEIK